VPRGVRRVGLSVPRVPKGCFRPSVLGQRQVRHHARSRDEVGRPKSAAVMFEIYLLESTNSIDSSVTFDPRRRPHLYHHLADALVLTSSLPSSQVPVISLSLLLFFPSRPRINYNHWDADQIQGCVCDPGFSGHDCAIKECPRGDDPTTTGQQNELMKVACTADGGYWFFSFRGETSRAIPYNAGYGTVSSTFESLFGLCFVLNFISFTI